jgi:hypothetical protein
MKLKALFLSLLVLYSLNTFAQKSFTGEITYKITYEGEMINEQVLAILPDQMSLIIKGAKSRTSLKTPMGDQVTIVNAKKMSVVNLIDMMGRKFAVKLTDQEIKNEQERYHNLKLTPIEEEKEIAGTLCKRIDVSIDHSDFDGETQFSAFYTTAFGFENINFSDPLYHDIKGIMLQYESEARGISMRFTAVSMEEKRIEDAEFRIPKGYDLTTKEEMKKSLGGF